MSDKLSTKEINDIEGNPSRNHDAILIVKQEDGNYRGFAHKNGTLVQVRAGDPNTVLQEIVTHG